MRTLVGAVLGSAIAACASVEPPASEPRQAEAFEARPPSRGTIIGGERVERVVQWPAEAEADADIASDLRAELRDAVDNAALPVLLPSALPLEQAKLMGGAQWYALWLQHDGLTITLNASGTARVHPHVQHAKKPHTVRGIEALVTQNESVWSASWVEFGVAFDLGIECDDPRAAACADGDVVRELAESLVFVGGRR